MDTKYLAGSCLEQWREREREEEEEEGGSGGVGGGGGGGGGGGRSTLLHKRQGRHRRSAVNFRHTQYSLTSTGLNADEATVKIIIKKRKKRRSCDVLFCGDCLQPR